jgi:hypothetical protein
MVRFGITLIVLGCIPPILASIAAILGLIGLASLLADIGMLSPIFLIGGIVLVIAGLRRRPPPKAAP